MTIYLEQTNYTTYYDFILENRTNADEALLHHAINTAYDYAKDHYYELEDLVIIKLRTDLYAVTGITNEWLPKEINSYVRVFNNENRATVDTELQIVLRVV